MKIFLRHPSGITKEVKAGFSWTTFFFGFFVPLIRGDFKWAAIFFVLAVFIGIFTMGIGGLIVGIVFAFKYNMLYTKELIEKGYLPDSIDSKRYLAGKGIQCELYEDKVSPLRTVYLENAEINAED